MRGRTMRGNTPLENDNDNGALGFFPRTSFLLNSQSNFPLAVIEAKDNNHSVSDPLEARSHQTRIRGTQLLDSPLHHLLAV